MHKNKSSEETINKIVDLMRRDNFGEDAPPAAIRQAKSIFLRRALEPKLSFAQKILAVLQFDSAANRPVFAERSASSAARQMFFQAGANGLDLRVSKTGKDLNLRGQILGENFAACTIKIVGANASFETQANDLSEFEFAKIPVGRYSLILQKGENEIAVEGLELS